MDVCTYGVLTECPVLCLEELLTAKEQRYS